MLFADLFAAQLFASQPFPPRAAGAGHCHRGPPPPRTRQVEDERRRRTTATDDDDDVRPRLEPIRRPEKTSRGRGAVTAPEDRVGSGRRVRSRPSPHPRASSPAAGRGSPTSPPPPLARSARGGIARAIAPPSGGPPRPRAEAGARGPRHRPLPPGCERGAAAGGDAPARNERPSRASLAALASRGGSGTSGPDDCCLESRIGASADLDERVEARGLSALSPARFRDRSGGVGGGGGRGPGGRARGAAERGGHEGNRAPRAFCAPRRCAASGSIWCGST